MSNELRPSKIPMSPLLAHLTDAIGEDLLPLAGFIGPSKNEGLLWLYPNLGDLSTCIEVAVADVVHSVTAPELLLPQEGQTILWVRSNSKITHRRTETVEVHKGRLRIRMSARPALRRNQVCQSVCGCQSSCQGAPTPCYSPRGCSSSCVCVPR